MTFSENVQLDKIIVHKVGNPTRGELLQLSQNTLTLNDPLVREMLAKYFLGQINEQEQYQFTHSTDLGLNEMYHYCNELFSDNQSFIGNSVKIAKLLYEKSTHVKIKNGELYVASFDKLPFENEFIKAIGIFKSESKQSFLKVFTHGQDFEVGQEEGININKLDKGCLVFQKNKESGFTVAIVDNTSNKNETQYWVEDFLQVTPRQNDYHNTDQYLGFCKQFFTKEYPDKFDVSKSDQIDMMSRSMDYFKTKDQFNLEEFTQEIIHHDEVIDSFISYKKQYENSKKLAIDQEFDINLSAVKKQVKSFKSILKLDKNFHIYVHGRRDLLEKGFDELTGKHFYKLYFDEEA